MRSQLTVVGTIVALVGGVGACGAIAPRSAAAPDGGEGRDGGAAQDLGSVDLAEAAAKDRPPPTPATIVSATPEPWGPNCPRGGVQIVTVLDRDGNRTIDPTDETVGLQYVCNVYPEQVSLGAQHGCLLASNGTVWCWGADDVGQLGDGGQDGAYAPRPVAGVERALALAAGGDFACVILPTTGVRCWGKNDRGQCGHGVTGLFIVPSCVSRADGNLLGATALALGGAHACVVLDDGTLACWGANEAGQVGDGTSLDRNAPVPVAGIGDARAVAAGGQHTCALLADTTVRCWGANDEGQLGDGTTTSSLAAVTVLDARGDVPLAGVTALAAGESFTCALMADATAVCWGANADCQLGPAASRARALLPVRVPVDDVASIVAGARHACAIRSAGTAVCWGGNDAGQSGVPSGACQAQAVPVPLAHVLSIGAGGRHSCAIDEAGLWCWGDDTQGQLGVGIASASRSSHEPQLAIWHLAP